MKSDPREHLAQLKAERAALDAEINCIESGLSKASYEASLANQLAAINDDRTSKGLPPMTMTRWMLGVDEELNELERQQK